MEDDSALMRAAESIVSNSTGRPVRFTSTQRLTGPDRKSALYRCRVADGEPAVSFILKTAGEARASNVGLDAWEQTGFFNDWIGAEFLSSLDPHAPIGPRFYGGDLQQGFFVLEDLGEHRSLVEPLLHGDPEAVRAGLQKYFTCLGTLHATTAGRAAHFASMYSARFAAHRWRGYAPASAFAEELHELSERIREVQLHMDQLSIPAEPGLAAEFEALTEAVTEPGPFLAYIHADPCPDNLFDLGDRYRLIDFEWGHFGHALLDAVYPRMLWPSCWCANRLPQDMIAAAENVYRAELVRGCPEAEDDTIWERGLVDMCGITLVNRLGWDLERALKEDHERGIATIRQRLLAQLDAFITTSVEYRALPALRAAATLMLSRLQTLWAETSPIPFFPAFRRPG